MRQETSQMLAKVFDVLRKEGTKKSDIAAQLSLTLDELNALTFMLTLSGIGSDDAAVEEIALKPRASNLRLVR